MLSQCLWVRSLGAAELSLLAMGVPRAAAPQGLTGQGPTSKLAGAVVGRVQFPAGCWLEAALSSWPRGPLYKAAHGIVVEQAEQAEQVEQASESWRQKEREQERRKVSKSSPVTASLLERRHISPAMLFHVCDTPERAKGEPTSGGQALGEGLTAVGQRRGLGGGGKRNVFYTDCGSSCTTLCLWQTPENCGSQSEFYHM